MAASDSPLTADCIRSDPTLLTKLARPDSPLRAWDGLCGALVNDHSFITSPNCPLLFDPPLGVNREIWMRNDFRYGEDDPLSWPQPYCPSRPHLPCMRLCERHQSDPDMPLFRLPISADFLELDGSSLIRGLGFWAADRRVPFEQRCKVILGQFATFPTGDNECIVGATRVAELRSNAVLFLERLKGSPMTFPRLCLCVAETQRLVLEIDALFKYFFTIRPRMRDYDGTSLHATDMDLVGCFTTSIRVAQQFHGAGVPVWVIRPLDQLVQTRIDAAVDINTVKGRIHLGPCPLRLRSVFIGSGAEEGKYKAFDRFTLSQIGEPNVFAWTSGGLRSETFLSGDTPNTAAEAVLSPYNQAGRSRKGHLKPGASNRFTVITHALLPDIHQPWRDALHSVNADKGRVHVAAIPYAFPRPDLFVTISDLAKRRSVLSAWLRIRPGHIAMQTSCYSPAKLSHQMWRTVLSYDWVGRSEESDRVRGKETKRRDLAATFLVGCLDEMSIQDGPSMEPTWQGKSISDLTIQDAHEIMWELSELGFRLEFLSLDGHLRMIDSDSILREHKRHLGHCFPRGRFDRCWMVQLAEAHRGLGDSSWMRRAPFICSLRRVLSTWKDCPESLRVEKERYTEEMLTSLLEQLATFYCDSFYLVFGRAPTLPRQLTHLPTVEADFPERCKSLSMASGYYLDITKWEAPY